jgi:mRNA-degrading endonuclease toxin of MazEF toxin-antitoxin module
VRVWQSEGVDVDSVINLDNIQTVPKSLLLRKVVRLRSERLAEVYAAIRFAFEMD